MSDVKTTPRFEHIYNADGTCHAFDCVARGLVLAYDEFSPEIAQWFCGMHWSQCEGVDMLTVAEDRRLPLFPAMFGTYQANEVTPGVFTHRWDWETTFNSVLGTRPSTTPIAINNVTHACAVCGKTYHGPIGAMQGWYGAQRFKDGERTIYAFCMEAHMQQWLEAHPDE